MIPSFMYHTIRGLSIDISAPNSSEGFVIIFDLDFKRPHPLFSGACLEIGRCTGGIPPGIPMVDTGKDRSVEVSTGKVNQIHSSSVDDALDVFWNAYPENGEGECAGYLLPRPCAGPPFFRYPGAFLTTIHVETSNHTTPTPCEPPRRRASSAQRRHPNWAQ